jgi:ribosomal protein S18 acetylase RimI-like enzyme
MTSVPPASLRKATLEDAPAIARIHVASWRETYRGILPDMMLAMLSTETREAAWRRILAAPAAFHVEAALVAELAGEPVGFGTCGRQRDARLAADGLKGEIGAIYLLRAAQGRGLGLSLMRRMFSELRSIGLDSAALWVLNDNRAARLFYERLGGAIVGERDEVRGEATLRETAYGWRHLPLGD